jgi:hypothetical protein
MNTRCVELPGFVDRNTIPTGIPRSHSATRQHPQLESPSGPHYENCGSTQECGEQQIETERDTPMNPEERRISGAQIL